MTTSAPQWPGQDEVHEGPETADTSTKPAPGPDGSGGAAGGPALRAGPDRPPPGRPRPPAASEAPPRAGRPIPPAPAAAAKAGPDARRAAEASGRVGRRRRLVVVRDTPDRELAAARRRTRANLPSPVAVTRDVAMALLEVEAGCRSAAQLERIFSPELWEAIQHRIGRRGGPLPSGRAIMTVHCQEDTPGLADMVAVVRLNHMTRASFQGACLPGSAELSGSLPRRVGYCVLPPLLNGSKKR
jgi:hypothetical protein